MWHILESKTRILFSLDWILYCGRRDRTSMFSDRSCWICPCCYFLFPHGLITRPTNYSRRAIWSYPNEWMARRLILLFIVAISLSTTVSEIFPAVPFRVDLRDSSLPDRRPPPLTLIESLMEVIRVCVDTAVYDHRPFVKELWLQQIRLH